MNVLTRSAGIAAICAPVLGIAGVVPGTAYATARTPAAGSPARSAVLSAADDGAIAGVVRSVTGAGLPGVCVAAVGRSIAVPSITGAGGRYLITGLLPGHYRLAYRACAQSARYAVTESPRQISVMAGRPAFVKPVALRPVSGAVLAAVSKPARGPASSAESRPAISGIVRNARGKPLAGICVSATQIVKGGAPPSPPGGSGAKTNKSGHYSIPANDVSPGRWLVGFAGGCGNKVNYAPQWWKYSATGGKAKVLTIRAGSHFTGIDAKLVPGAAIRGVVRAGRKSGPGLAGACVLATGVAAARYDHGQAISKAGGKFLVTGLGTGRYQVRFEPCDTRGNYAPGNYPREVAVADGKTTTGIDWYLPRAGEITGTVTSQNKKTVPGICVVAASESGGVVSVQEAVTGQNGHYAELGLTQGKYGVYFAPGCGNSGSYVAQYYDGQANPANASLVKVGRSQTVTIDASLELGGTVTGKVTNAAGQGLSGICVVLAPDLRGLGSAPVGLPAADLGAVFGSVGVSSGGSYRVTDMAPGNYEVSFSDGCGSSRTSPYAAQWFAPQGGNGPAWLSVGTAPISDINAVLKHAGVIKGLLTNRAGRPVEGICTLTVPLTGEAVPSLIALITQASSGSNRHGLYQITGLGPGKYDVEFMPCDLQPYASSWYGGDGDESTARPVGVKDGHATSGIDQTLTAGEEISGRIAAAGGVKLGAVCVFLLDTSGNLVFGDASTARGYGIPLIAPGAYRLEVGPCDNPTLATVLKSVTVRATMPTKANVSLPLAGSISGTVAGEVAADIPMTTALDGICVAVTPVSGPGAPSLAFSGPDGQFRIGGLAPGKYQVTFSSLCPYGPPAYANLTLASPVTVTSSHTARVGGDMPANGWIAGTITVSGAPAARVCVLAYPAAGGAPTLAVTRQNGYQIAGLPAGSYTVEFTAGCGAGSYQTQWYNGAASRAAATAVTVADGEVTGNIDAH